MSVQKKLKTLPKALLIFPNSLVYNVDALQKANVNQIFVVEEPLYFGHHKLKPYNISKIKLAYMRASMKSYQDWLTLNGFKQVQYIDYDQIDDYKFCQPFNVTLYDPIDFDLETRLSKFFDYQKLESLLFLQSSSKITEYFQSKTKNKFLHAHFFNWMKKDLKILENVSSTDKDNRKSLPKNHSFKFKNINFKSNHHYEEAIEWVNNHPTFKTNIGSTDHLLLYPINDQDAKILLQDFIKSKFNNFGDYEDAIDSKHAILFHGFISPALNSGILSPKFVLHQIMEMKGKVPMNSLEGFVRQLIGWREYQRGIYISFYKEIMNSNYFNYTRKLNWDYWNGIKQSGIPILDNEIKKALSYGYSHHIVRLMVFLNIFVLLGIRLQDVVQWFSQTICMDAYPWVMYSNIVSMGYYDTRFMQKPYVSTSAYLLKMSNYPKGPWCEIWTSLFYRFLHLHKAKLIGGASIYLRNLKHFESKSEQDQKNIISMADRFINKVTEL
ncbi:DNA photolyase, FAD-binding/Cryptochrome [Globomyces pollinis-pini]|nr:DNA photolyase, FAD-binding/Cryptochrome [Globomyces pollinis-pini]